MNRVTWDAKGTGRPGRLGVVHDDAVDGVTKAWLGSGGQIKESFFIYQRIRAPIFNVLELELSAAIFLDGKKSVSTGGSFSIQF